MSENQCDRITVLEQSNRVLHYRTKEMCKKFEAIETRQQKIFTILIKIQYTAYGAAGLLISSQLGITEVLKTIIAK